MAEPAPAATALAEDAGDAGRSPREDPLVRALRAAGCVFAEEEAAILREAARDADELERLLRARVAGAALEPLVGWVGFDGLRLSIGPGVFVPRQRSRQLAALAVAATRAAGEGAVMVEAFAGVAPIAAVVAQQVPAAQVHAIEVDEAALVHARRNLDPSRVHAGDVLDGLPARLLGRIDVLAAVAPYVPDAHAPLLPREAREQEGASALFGGADGLDHVRSLLDACPAWLAPTGTVLLELHREQMPDAAAHARDLLPVAVRHLEPGEGVGVLELGRRA